MGKEQAELIARIGVDFSDTGILTEALTHRSYLNEHPDWTGAHNERLEFLGDAVLELIVTQHLYETFPEHPEGKLTNLRAALVRTETLAEAGADLALTDAILLSRGEEKDDGRARDQILANTMEALIGAIYLDQGFTAAEQFVERNVLSRLQEVIADKRVKDAKSLFQEAAQAQMGVTPHYDVLKEWGPDHKRRFKIGAYLEGKLAGEGEGDSKQEAQQAAAENALKKQGWS